MRQEWLKGKVKGASKYVFPGCTICPHLAEGLNFVESKEMNKVDRKYDMQEFLRKLEQRIYFHKKSLEESLDNEIGFNQEENPDLRIPSRNT